MNEKHIFVELLKLGESRGVIGLNSHEFKEWALSQAEIENEHAQSYQNINRIFKESFDEIDKGYGNPNIFVLKNEYYFRLVEFEELRLSRETAISAKRYSVSALTISVLAVIISLAASYVQIISPISIEQDQINDLKIQLEQTRDLHENQQRELKQELQSQSAIQEKIVTELQSLNKLLQPTANASAE
jgi:hypothetical protein